MVLYRRIDQLTAASGSPAGTDLVELELNPNGTPSSVKSTIDQLAASTAFSARYAAIGSGGGGSGTPGSKWYNGAGAPSTATGIIGDYYINDTTADIYEKTGTTTWTLRLNIKGSAGATGAAGSAGAAGATGATGAAGSVWRTGSGAPAGALGVVGDFYLNTANGDYYEKTATTTYTLRGNLTGPTGSGGTGGTSNLDTNFPVTLGVALSDENTALTTGTKARFRAPYAFTITDVRVAVNTSGSAGPITVNITNGSGATIFTTKPTIPASTLTTVGVSPARAFDSTKVNITDDELLTFSIDTINTTGTATGLKVWVIGTRSLTTSATAPGQASMTTVASAASLANGTTPVQITLTWSAPSNGGSTITGYKVEGSTNGTNWTTAATGGVINNNYTGGLSYTVTTFDGTNPLVLGTTYYFRVSAINLIGTGSASNSLSGAPRTVPAQITGLGATAGTGQAVLSWTAPTGTAGIGGSAITDYVVEYKRTSATGTTVTGDPTTGWTVFSDGTSTGTTATVTGLTNAVSYDFRVAAVNAAGQGLYQSASVSATPTASSGNSPAVRGFAFADKPTLSTTAVVIDTATSFTSRPQAGDLIVVIVSDFSDTSSPPTTPSGFTKYGATVTGGAGVDYQIFYKTAAGTSGNTSDTTYSIGGTASWAGYVGCYAFNGGTAIDAIGTSLGQLSTTTSVAASGVSPTVANTTIVSHVFISNLPSISAMTQAFGTTQRTKFALALDYSSSNVYAFGSQTISASGPTGTKTWTVTATVATGYAYDSLAIAVK